MLTDHKWLVAIVLGSSDMGHFHHSSPVLEHRLLTNVVCRGGHTHTDTAGYVLKKKKTESHRLLGCYVPVARKEPRSGVQLTLQNKAETGFLYKISRFLNIPRKSKTLKNTVRPSMLSGTGNGENILQGNSHAPCGGLTVGGLGQGKGWLVCPWGSPGGMSFWGHSLLSFMSPKRENRSKSKKSPFGHITFDSPKNSLSAPMSRLKTTALSATAPKCILRNLWGLW